VLFLKVIKICLPWLLSHSQEQVNALTSFKEFRIINSLKYLSPLINLKPELDSNRQGQGWREPGATLRPGLAGFVGQTARRAWRAAQLLQPLDGGRCVPASCRPETGWIPPGGAAGETFSPCGTAWKL